MTQTVRYLAGFVSLTSPKLYLFNAAGTAVGEVTGYALTETPAGSAHYVNAAIADAVTGTDLIAQLRANGTTDVLQVELVTLTGVASSVAIAGGSAADTANAVAEQTDIANMIARIDTTLSSRLSSSGHSAPILSSFNLLTGLTSGSGTLADDANEAIAAAVAAESTIAAKLALIGTGSATVSTPVADDGQITSAIIIGDDYLAANGRAFEWTIDEITGITAATASCQFGASHRTKGSFLVTGTITDNGSTWTLSFDVTRTDTADCEKGEYDWSVQVTDASGNELTRVRNATDCYKVQLVEKQT